MIHNKWGRMEHAGGMNEITRVIRGLTFSTTNPRPMVQRGDDLLIIQGSIRDVTTHRVYIDTERSLDIIYEHCFRLVMGKWKEGLKTTPGQLTSFTGHNIWPLGMIQLPLMLTSYNKSRPRQPSSTLSLCGTLLSIISYWDKQPYLDSAQYLPLSMGY